MSVIAPSSAEDAQANAVNTLARVLTNLGPGLEQAQTDGATLAALLASWPSDLPADLQPVVQIVARLVADTAEIAEGVQSILVAMQVF
jgi:hypothetical protein